MEIEMSKSEKQNPAFPGLPVITGRYGVGIEIYDANTGKLIWNWTGQDASDALQGELYVQLRNAILDKNGNIKGEVTDAKFADGGSKIVAIIADAAVVINCKDKSIHFGIYREWAKGSLLGAMHSLEMLPDNNLAIATDLKEWDDSRKSEPRKPGVAVYDMGPAVLPDSAPRRMEGYNLSSCHALVWDESQQILWAAGTSKWPANPSDKVYTRLVGYHYSRDALTQTDTDVHEFPSASLGKSDPAYSNWVEGGHDLVPVPNERRLIVTTDIDLYEYDLEAGSFYKFEDFTASVKAYFSNYECPVEARKISGFPRSAMKSLRLSKNGLGVHTQSNWRGTDSYLDEGDHTQQVYFFGVDAPDNLDFRKFGANGWIYKARWFDEVPGWLSAGMKE
ncbi:MULTISPECIES: hypothetical protein [unclassified Streptomyces]|uniref:hypothetical protein n=1 Tax=unclassified Streptomyces TaxID=2593676 RepID=UPI0021C86606|nr:hypothetical protein [Streptomyces sp. FIT100]UUN26082.1 hypothetical protein KK483_06315 [Streptomyces sp. FIT100]